MQQGNTGVKLFTDKPLMYHSRDGVKQHYLLEHQADNFE
jgi:hypothetical protein